MRRSACAERIRMRSQPILVRSAALLALAACASPRAYPGPARQREEVATISGAEAPKESESGGRIRILSLADAGGTPVHGGGRGAIELAPGTYQLRVRRDLPGAALTTRLPAGVPGSASAENEQELRVALEADWAYRVFYDWKAGAFAVLREAAVLRPRQFRGIDAPAAALRCTPEGEPPVATCRFAPSSEAEACFRAIVDLDYRGGYERAELLVRGRDEARAARAAALLETARIEVAELQRLAESASCD
jgi:hypothetical protein